MRRCWVAVIVNILFVLLCVSLPQSVLAKVQFSPTAWPQDTGAPVNSSPVLGDLDRDGILEIIVGSDNNKVYAWKPDGTLMPGWPVTTNDSVRSSPALADINGDGYLDVIVGSFDNKVYAWNYNGSLLPGWPVTTGSVIYSSPAVGDIDGDQLPEIVVGSFDNKVYAWNADGTLVRGWPKPTGLFVYSSPALADIDYDGLVEVIIGTDNNRVFAWNGDGTDVEGWPTATEHVVPSSPAVGDVDNDGELEVVVGSWDKVFMWNSQGERKPGWPVKADHQIPSSPALADLTNDGNLEIIIGCKDGKVYAWNAQGQLLQGWPTITDAEISGSPIVADLNDDNNLEVIIGSKDSKVYIWDVAGRLLPGWPQRTGGAISSTAAVGDTDQDGSLELVIGSKDHKVYAWNFPSIGASQPTIAWQNFRGNPSRTGKYGDAVRSVYLVGTQAEPSIIAPQTLESQTVEPQILEAPISGKQVRIIHARPGLQMEQAGTRTLPSATPSPQQTLRTDSTQLQVLAEGYVNDLTISDYDDNSITLTWTSPLGAYTPQAMYDIRFSPQPITEETWDLAQQYPEIIPLAPAGKREVQQLDDVTLPARHTGQILYIAVKIVDKARGAFVPVSPLSNVVGLEAVDNEPPAKIQELAVKELNETTLELSWKAPGDDGTQGVAKQYDIRYAEVPLNELTWLRAVQVDNIPAPLPAGMEQKIQLSKPWKDREIFWGIKAIDNSLNISELSEVAVWNPRDVIPSSQITVSSPSGIPNLEIQEIGREQVTVTWTAQGAAAAYILRYGQNIQVVKSWENAANVQGLSSPGPIGTREAATIGGLQKNTTYYVGLRMLDDQGNLSETSNILRVRTLGHLGPDIVTDLIIEELRHDGVTINWTAPGQNLGNEVAGVKGYDIRYSLSEITENNWETATKLRNIPSPSMPKTLEILTIADGPKDSPYYVALKSYDELGNTSELSNVLEIPGIDTTPPAPIIDLFVENNGQDWVKISWTATGNDQNLGQAEAQIIRLAPNLKQLKQWDQAKVIPNTLTPSPAGMKDTFTIIGLQSDSTYYVAIKSVDAFGNESELSNIVRAKTRDAFAPAAIRDLQSIETEADTIVLQWTAPGENGREGQAKSYDVRYAQETITPRNWQLMPTVSQIPVPEPAGTRQTITVSGLQSNTKYYFSIVTIDGSGNPSPLSNVLEALTEDTLAPGVITTLRAEDVDSNSVFLSWLSPGDDDLHDTPGSYEVRHSTLPLSEASWSKAAQAQGSPRPSPKGEEERFLLSGLRENSSYYIGVKTIDIGGNASQVSNVVRIYTSEDAVTDLKILDFTPEIVTLSWTAPGGVITDEEGRRYDIRYATTRISEETWDNAMPVPNLSPQNLMLKQPGMTETFVLPGLPSYEQMFFAIRVTPEFVEDEFDPRISVLSNVVKLERSDSMPPAEVADLMVTDLGPAPNGTRSFEISWTAPGDNQFDGIASKYELRYGMVPPNEGNWESLTSVYNVPAPLPAETLQRTQVQIPSGEDTVYFALRTFDEAANFSGLSNTAQWMPEDLIPPARIINLKAERLDSGDIKLSWTAPGDNENRGIAALYDLRYTTKETDLKGWDKAILVQGEPLPEVGGTLQEYMLTGLRKDTTYYLAMTATDDVKNTSGMSNIAVVVELPPEQIHDLEFEGGTETTATLTWTAPQDRVADRVVSYEIRYSEDLEKIEQWKRAKKYKNNLLPKESGATESITVEKLAPNKRYYFAIKALDHSKELSEMSNIEAAYTTDTIPPKAIGDLVVKTTSEHSATLTWTVIEDDQAHETPKHYEVRYGLDPITEANWEEALFATDQWLEPSSLGSQMEYRIGNLEENTLYHFAVRAFDGAGNESPLSNIVLARTQDITPPQAIADLKAAYPTAGSVMLSWTAPSDPPGASSRSVSDNLILAGGGAVEETLISAYDIRYFKMSADGSELDGWTWENAEKVPVPPMPLSPGIVEEFVVRNLASNQTYYFAIKSIDQSGNVSGLSNVVLETTFPTDLALLQSTRAIAPEERLAWKLVQGQEFGELQQNTFGGLSFQKKREARGLTTAAAMTAVFPSNNIDLDLRQGELTFQVKGSSPFTICTRVTARDSGNSYHLCYMRRESLDTEMQETRGLIAVPVTPERRRIGNYVFYSIDPVPLDNGWYEVRRDLTRDLLEGTGHLYKQATRFSIRGEDVAFKNIIVQGAVFTSLADFEDGFAPLENGWKLHFGKGTVQLAQESVSGSMGKPDGKRSILGGPVIAGITPRGIQGVEEVNSFLYARSVDDSSIVLTYPRSGMGELSDKPFFLATIKAGPDFKLILKIRTKGQQEYYLAFLPESTFPANSVGATGNYIYLPLHMTALGDGWTLIRADIKGGLQHNQLDYAYTTWLSFHSRELSIDDVGFSTDVLITPLQ